MSESIDVVVHCARAVDGPRVTEVIAVEDLAAGPDATQFTVTQLFTRPRVDEQLAWTGNLPSRAGRLLQEAGFELRELLGPLAERTGTAGLYEAATRPRFDPRTHARIDEVSG